MNETLKTWIERILWAALFVVAIACGWAAYSLKAEAAQPSKTPIVCAPKAAKAIILLTPANRSAWKAERRAAEDAKGGKKPKAQRKRIKR